MQFLVRIQGLGFGTQSYLAWTAPLFLPPLHLVRRNGHRRHKFLEGFEADGIDQLKFETGFLLARSLSLS